MTLPAIDTTYLLRFLSRLLNTPSPTGFTAEANRFLEQELADFPGVSFTRNRKDTLMVTIAGERNDHPRALSAHVDTLGAMVKEIRSNGRLRMTQLGGYPWNTVEGEGVTVFARDGRRYRGSILIQYASSHVYGKKVSDTPREADTLEIRLDERTTSASETEALGIGVGDFIAFDPRVEITNGFVRSRHLDDKACVACIMAAVKAISDASLKPRQKTYILFSNFEEVGHGAAPGFPAEVEEMLTVDMAAVGDGQTSDEFHTTLCVKDSGGPYHPELNERLRTLAEKHQIPHKIDIYPYYGSDGTALWRAGGNLAVSLIGPGVDASHNYERTHVDALEATARWITAYLLD